MHYAASTEPICFDDSVKNIVEKFKDNSVDFHQTVADLANIKRKDAKTINLGLFYGMGKAKLQAELGLNTKQAQGVLEFYKNNMEGLVKQEKITIETSQVKA